MPRPLTLVFSIGHSGLGSVSGHPRAGELLGAGGGEDLVMSAVFHCWDLETGSNTNPGPVHSCLVVLCYPLIPCLSCSGGEELQLADGLKSISHWLPPPLPMPLESEIGFLNDRRIN